MANPVQISCTSTVVKSSITFTETGKAHQVQEASRDGFIIIATAVRGCAGKEHKEGSNRERKGGSNADA